MSTVLAADLDLPTEKLAKIFKDQGWTYGWGDGEYTPDEYELLTSIYQRFRHLRGSPVRGGSTESGRILVLDESEGGGEFYGVFLRIGSFVPVEVDE